MPAFFQYLPPSSTGAKEVGGVWGGRKLRRLRWFLPPQFEKIQNRTIRDNKNLRFIRYRFVKPKTHETDVQCTPLQGNINLRFIPISLALAWE